MAGVADSAFRQLCKEFGCGLLTSEMVSAKALTMSDRKTKDLLRRAPIE
ncbi:MAG: tRNA-dihydrouridine synthase, partial [Faecalibacterium sp.]|nr:tRNA-dihydrouridine synthase [Faecalibacterium sp.]